MTVGLGLRWEDTPVGMKFRTIGRSVTDADITLFVGVTGMVEVLFTNLEYLEEESLFAGKRLCPGALVYSFAEGLLMQTVVQGVGLSFLGMELNDFWGIVNAYVDNKEKLQRRVTKPTVKLINISCSEFYLKSNYQDFQRFQPIDLAIAGDAQATLPSLIESVKQAMTPAAQSRVAARAEPMRAAHRANIGRMKVAASQGWNATPISVARMCTEVSLAITGTDWCFLGMDSNQSFWPSRYWPMEKHHHHLGNSGGYGLGYSLPAAVGAALANKKLGRITVAIIGDGDMLYTPGALWSAAGLELPLLIVVHNNRAYHQETMHLRRMSNFRSRRPTDNAAKGDFEPVGTSIMSPNVDFAKLAQSMGVWSTGPIGEPNLLAGALKRAMDVVKSGAPALVDVLTQPR